MSRKRAVWLAIVVTALATVVTTNLPSRSKVIADQVEVFRDNVRAARRVTLEEWHDRPLQEELSEQLAGLPRGKL